MIKIVLTFLLAISVFSRINSVCSLEITCTDDNNNEEEWFIVYKLPRNSTSKDLQHKTGNAFTYLVFNDYEEWIVNDIGISNSSNIVGKALSPLYNNKEEIAYIVYNDQPPTGPVIDVDGHSKGVILANENGGIWLVHSVPHFPILGETYSYPRAGLRNGQVFFCITLNATQIDGLGNTLMYTRPHIYNSSMPEFLKNTFPTLTRVIQNERIKSPPWYNLSHLDVGLDYCNPLHIKVFAKGPKYQEEIYSDWIAKELKTSLNVQSWLNGPNPFPSNCQAEYEVHNILLINTNMTMRVDEQKWSTHSDHSKWAISRNNPDSNWICIGDLNRMEHQMKRGGAVLCMNDSMIRDRFVDLIQDVQPCPRGNEIE